MDGRDKILHPYRRFFIHHENIKLLVKKQMRERVSNTKMPIFDEDEGRKCFMNEKPDQYVHNHYIGKHGDPKQICIISIP